MVRTQPLQGCNDRFESGADLHTGISPSGPRPRPLKPVSLVQIQLSQPYDAVLKRLRGQSAKLLVRRFESGPHLQTVPSSNWSGRQPLKLEIAGSNPAGITNMEGEPGRPRDRLLSGSCPVGHQIRVLRPPPWNRSPTGRASS